jgi:glycosyltransferase involved in cell wall biosynthesis
VNTPDLALVVIARDAESSIRRLLETVTPWVDRVLVLDTGSTDETRQVAARLSARVESLAWTDDFSAARNAALDLAAANWHLVLDADEWLIEGGEFLRQLRHIPPEFVGQVQLLDGNRSESDGTSATARTWISRLLPGHVRYAGRIHEQPVHQLPVHRTPLVIGHDGYRPEALAAKRGRNRRLLQADLRDHPEDPYLLYQLGKDADVYNEHALAAQSFAAAWPRVAGSAPWRLDLVVRWMGSLKRLRRHEEALHLIHATQAEFDTSPDFHFAIGDLMLDWTATAPQQANDLLGKAEQAWRRCLSLGERPEQPGSVPGRGGHLAAFNLALVLEGTGRGAEAAELRRRFGLPTGRLLG